MPSVSDDVVLTLSEGVPSMTRIEDNRVGFTNVADALVVGDVVYVSGSGSVAKANAASAAKRPPIGVVCEVVTSTTCQVMLAGGTVRGLSGLTAGAVYYLSPVTDGAMTTTKASTYAFVVGVAQDANQLTVLCLPVDVSRTVALVAPAGDTAINSITDVSVVSSNLTDIAVGDQILVDCMLTIFNNSTAARVYVITLDINGLFDIEFTTGSLAFSATLEHPFILTASFAVRSTSLSYQVVECRGQLATGLAAGGDTTTQATNLQAMGWGSSAANMTGTQPVQLKVRSASATATQTCRVHSFVVRKVSPT